MNYVYIQENQEGSEQLLVVVLTLLLEKKTHQLFLEMMHKDNKDKKVVENSQCGSLLKREVPNATLTLSQLKPHIFFPLVMSLVFF